MYSLPSYFDQWLFYGTKKSTYLKTFMQILFVYNFELNISGNMKAFLKFYVQEIYQLRILF